MKHLDWSNKTGWEHVKLLIIIYISRILVTFQNIEHKLRLRIISKFTTLSAYDTTGLYSNNNNKIYLTCAIIIFYSLIFNKVFKAR